jgi:predicted dehydrogenase
MREFVRCLRESGAPSVTGQDGLMAAVMGIAAKKSIAEARPVRLSEIRLVTPEPGSSRSAARN